ncbi:hypothetical protein BJF85_22675 [Saccharomonospora sp. CUA-673]|nr:hypothetical protein BJF85_22675 [Saccharomonospora sp. CUA-673]
MASNSWYPVSDSVTERFGEPLGDEGVHDRRLGAMRRRQAGQHRVRLDGGMRDQARPVGQGFPRGSVMFVPAGER